MNKETIELTQNLKGLTGCKKYFFPPPLQLQRKDHLIKKFMRCLQIKKDHVAQGFVPRNDCRKSKPGVRLTALHSAPKIEL